MDEQKNRPERRKKPHGAVFYDCPLIKIFRGVFPYEYPIGAFGCSAKEFDVLRPSIMYFASKWQDKTHKLSTIISRVLILSKKNVIFFSMES
jgi:hypothetical protein